MSLKIAVGTASFAKYDDAPVKFLEAKGIKVVMNPFGRRPSEEELLAFLPGMDGLIAGMEPLTRNVLVNCPDLKAIARVGIGMDTVDLKAAEELGIKVSNTPEAPVEAVAEMTVAVMLNLCRKITETNTVMHSKEWEKSLGFSLRGTKILIIGYGRIGKKTVDFLQPFNAEILVCDPAVTQKDLPDSIHSVSLEQGLESADIISFHCTGGQTILTEERFKLLKSGIIILNPSRGELVDQNFLIKAIKSKRVSGAWFDAFENEPYSGPMCDVPEIILTPHNATFTKQCRLQMEMDAAQKILSLLQT